MTEEEARKLIEESFNKIESVYLNQLSQFISEIENTESSEQQKQFYIGMFHQTYLAVIISLVKQTFTQEFFDHLIGECIEFANRLNQGINDTSRP